MEKLLISIITSEKTWTNFSKFGFDKQITRLRNEFDLSVVLNGNNNEAINYYNNFKPEYFFLRPNLGFDTAAIAYLIDLIPEYEHYLIMHDDHWFPDDDWLEQTLDLRKNNPDVDIWGNLLYDNPRIGFNEYCSKLNVPKLADYDLSQYLHGMSGIFSSKAVKLLKKYKIPYMLDKDKENANMGERLFSSVIYHQALKMESFPDGPYIFFKHNEGNYRNHLFSSANMYLYFRQLPKAKEYYYKYYEHCKKNNYLRNMTSLFYNLACVHYELNEKKEAKVILENLLKEVPNFPIPSSDREILMELINNPEY